jgi:hypothetical protein
MPPPEPNQRYVVDERQMAPYMFVPNGDSIASTESWNEMASFVKLAVEAVITSWIT